MSTTLKIAVAALEPEPYYYHILKVTPPDSMPKRFWRISRSAMFPLTLKNIADVAIAANSMFNAQLIIEKAMTELEQQVMKPAEVTPDFFDGIAPENQSLINDKYYVESDCADDRPEVLDENGNLKLPNWTSC